VLCDDDETDWKKQVPLLPALSFDSIGIMPSQPFLLSEYRFFSLTKCTIFWSIRQTCLYAVQQNILNWHNVSKAELKAFFGILIAMGLHSLPDIEL